MRSISLLSLCILRLNLWSAEPVPLRIDAPSFWQWEYYQTTNVTFQLWWGQIRWAKWTNFALVSESTNLPSGFTFTSPAADPFPWGTNVVTLTAVVGEIESDPSNGVPVDTLTNSAPPVTFNLLTVSIYQGRPFVQLDYVGQLQHAASVAGPFTNAPQGFFPPGDAHFWTVTNAPPQSTD